MLQVVASAIVDKYIGESARVVREMFGYAKVGGGEGREFNGASGFCEKTKRGIRYFLRSVVGSVMGQVTRSMLSSDRLVSSDFAVCYDAA